MKNTKSIYHFKVTLDVDFKDRGKEKSWREVAVLSSQSLSTLARIIVQSFDFYFDHCYGFYNNFKNPYHSSEKYELFTDIGEEPTEGALGVEHIKITRAFDKTGKKMRFLFDYGDNWQFAVELLDIKPASGGKYPKVIKKVGNAPEQYPDYDKNDDKEESN